MLPRTLLFIVFFGLSTGLVAQENKLKQLAAENDSTEALKKQRVLEYCRKNNLNPKFTRDGKTYLMSDVSVTGIPIYEKTHNAGASKTVGVNELRTGGSLGINLTGTNMRVGVWDGGRSKIDHPELNGRVTISDGSSELSAHATHVTGTILASGINTSAKGMAPNATALSFDFSNDLTEMISQSNPDQTTLLLSNHSYGTVAGWERNGSGWDWAGDPAISAVEDYKFGFYDSRARAWDNLCFSSPYYTIVKSSGNDREDDGDGSRPADKDYNSISTYGNAKNIITVGAVNKIPTSYSGPSSVIMSSFSSWGPTDDGRIKPDICAPGVNIFSTISGVAGYDNMSGTSMSSPVVTGSLALLQQLNQQLNQNYLRAATLKALVIHTAKEAGPQPGPDYSFGWGLLDAEAAAKVILTRDDVNTQIVESTLNNTGTFQMELFPVENQKITATLVWTDPAGTPPPASLNPTNLMLVNDLDIKIVDDNGNEQLPWVLNPASPNAAATHGNNIRDNVEKIEFTSPQPIKYYLRVSHKNTLVNNAQNFSLILTYTSTTDQRVTYYWVGGSGNWNSTAHWSLTSGGASAGSVPTADDRVIFDENSSAANGETVTLTAPGNCYSFYWLTSKAFNLNLNNQLLSIHENVLISTSSLTISTPGTFNMIGHEGNYTFNSAQPDLRNLSLSFGGDYSNWKFVKDIDINSLTIETGSVDLSGLKVQVNTLADLGITEKELNLTGTEISNNQLLNINLNDGTSVISDGASVIQASGYDINFSIGSESFAGTILLDDTGLSIGQANTIEHLSGQGTVTVQNDVLISDLELDAGSSVIIQSDKTLTLTDAINLQSTSGNQITIQNDGINNATITVLGNYKICEDNLVITNVDFTGSSVFAVGNSTLNNSSGWLSTTCDNLLFADFTFQYNCENSYLYLTNTSDGNPEAVRWIIDGTEVSTEEKVYYKITESENLSIRLEITKGELTDDYEIEIPILENPLPENHLVRSEDRLYSFVQSPSYQWLLDGEIMEGETQRFVVYTQQSGDYSVLTFNETCNRESGQFVITGIESGIHNTFITVFPNPVKSTAYFTSVEPVFKILAYDMLGKAHSLNFSLQNARYEMNVLSLPAGVYLLKFYSAANGLIGHAKILKQKN